MKTPLPINAPCQTRTTGVILSDGIEADFLDFNSGTRATIGLAAKQGCLVS